MDPIESDVLLQEPVPYRVVWKDGTKETFLLPRLGVDGLIPWLDEITEERRAVSRIVVSKMKLGATDAQRAEKSIMLNDVATIGDLIGPIQRPAGIRRVITLSVEKSEIPKDKQASVIASIMGSAMVANAIAQRVSTLFYLEGEAEIARQSVEPPKPTGGLAGPLAEPVSTPAAPASESPTTGLASV